MNTRIVHTGLFTDDAVRILNNFFDYLLICGSTRQTHIAERVKFVRGADNEVLIEAVLQGSYFKARNRSYSSVANSRTIWDHREDTDAKFRTWIAVNIKQQVIASAKSDGAWRRNNTNVIKHFCERIFDSNVYNYGNPKLDEQGKPVGCIPVNEFYFIYDFFLGRQNLSKRYGSEMVARIQGTRRDPILTEMELNRRQQIKNLELEAQTSLNTLSAECRRLKDELDTQYNLKRKEVVAERDRKIAELNAQTDAVLKLHAA